MEKQILTDEFDDPKFLAFAIENYSEIFSYIVKGNLNIRIHKEDAIRRVNPPKRMSDKQDMAWGRVELFLFHIAF